MVSYYAYDKVCYNNSFSPVKPSVVSSFTVENHFQNRRYFPMGRWKYLTSNALVRFIPNSSNRTQRKGTARHMQFVLISI